MDTLRCTHFPMKSFDTIIYPIPEIVHGYDIYNVYDTENMENLFVVGPFQFTISLKYFRHVTT